MFYSSDHFFVVAEMLAEKIITNWCLEMKHFLKGNKIKRNLLNK
jgi:hypothetical protein